MVLIHSQTFSAFVHAGGMGTQDVERCSPCWIEARQYSEVEHALAQLASTLIEPAPQELKSREKTTNIQPELGFMAGRLRQAFGRRQVARIHRR